MTNDGGIDDSFFELHRIYLHPDVFRKGIGTVAMNFAFDKARSAGKTDMIVRVFAKNTNSIQFYESCGFTKDGARKSYRCGNRL